MSRLHRALFAAILTTWLIACGEPPPPDPYEAIQVIRMLAHDANKRSLGHVKITIDHIEINSIERRGRDIFEVVFTVRTSLKAMGAVGGGDGQHMIRMKNSNGVWRALP